MLNVISEGELILVQEDDLGNRLYHNTQGSYFELDIYYIPDGTVWKVYKATDKMEQGVLYRVGTYGNWTYYPAVLQMAA